MKISKISIQNFRQFQDFELDLTYPENHPKAGKPLDKVCFIGGNGTGKSTLLINLYTDNRIQNSDLIIYSPAETHTNSGVGLRDVPSVILDHALRYFKNFPTRFEVSNDSIRTFWELLIFLIKKRENDLKEFEEREENLDKTIREVRTEFDKANPDILQEIAKLWNKILDKAGLEFDIKNASKPIQLTDNLKAYIKTKNATSETNKKVNYNQLSTGIRNFIFRLGHIFTLYFNREIKNGILLIDEPENSLFPDFLYDLVDTYLGIIQNTQLFMATHSPIIAAQFEPCERVILEFGENGKVYARKGNSPAGDDPNDLLIRDFGVRNILGKEGVKKWERYIELKILIKHETDTTVKQQLMQEFMKIGQAYNFPAP